MIRTATVPFTIRRSKDEFGTTTFSSTTETVHGLLRLEGEEVIIQWRLDRKTERYSATSIKTDEDMEPVREVVIPLDAVAGALVRKRWWEFWRGPRMVLTAADLHAFDQVAGDEGLRLAHPAEMVVALRREDRMLAEEFSAELTLAVAELTAGESGSRRRITEETADPEGREGDNER